jgi:hypothetical protein
MVRIPKKDQRGNSETGDTYKKVKNVADLPQSDQPVDPFEAIDAPARDTEGVDVTRRDFSGESGTGKG